MSLNQDHLSEGKTKRATSKSTQETESSSKVASTDAKRLAGELRSAKPKGKKQRGLSKWQLKQIHSKRTQKARDVDESLQASMPPSFKAWAKDPAKYDISGIDYPEEWRSKDEIERLQDLDKYLPIRRKELKEAKMRGEDTANLEENLKLFTETQTLLKWQKKHPFLSAGVDADKIGSGKENYDWALKNKIDFGFNVRDPENSFLHNFYLKKHDIKGMRVILERDNRKMPGARAWYSQDTKLFHLPPESAFKQDQQQWTRKTILHEIGHHVMNQNPELQGHWAGQHYAFNYPVKKGTQHTGEIQQVNLTPSEVIYGYYNFFGYCTHFDARYNKWRGKALSESDLKKANLKGKWRQTTEFWAETFAQYRLGNLRREIKERQAKIDLIDGSIKFNKGLMKQHKGPKTKRPYTTMKRNIKALERERKVASTQHSNLLKFHRMLKRWDQKGWNPNYDVERKMK